MNVQKWLTEGEYHEYQMWKHWASSGKPRQYSLKAVAALEALAACRALIAEASKAHDDNWIDSWFTANKERIATALQGLPKTLPTEFGEGESDDNKPEI